jgi:hypothetical protein
MAKVLSLMATHSGDRSQYFKSAAEIDDQLSNIEENKRYAAPQKAQLQRYATPQKAQLRRCEAP